MNKLFLCCFALLAACDADGFKEIREGHTAEIYACGNWKIEQVNQIAAAIDDFNVNVTLSSGNEPYHFMGVSLTEDTYEEADSGDGFHCIYRVYEDYPTSYGRRLWQEYHLDESAGALFDEDDIAIFGNYTCPIPDRPCTWKMQNLVTHELGHGCGAPHLSADGTKKGVLTPRPSSWLLTPDDRQIICQSTDCL